MWYRILLVIHLGSGCNLSLSSGVSAANLLCWLVLIRCNLPSLFSGVSPANLSCWLVLIRCNLPSLFSGFHLPTFRAGWCSSAVIFLLSLRGFQLPFFHVHGYLSAVLNLRSLSSGVSAAILSRSQVLLCCEVLGLSFTSSLSSAPGTIPLPPLSQSFAPLRLEYHGVRVP